MMLTGRNEWLVIGALILWIAFVPCPYAMKQFFSTPIGKVLALGAVIYVWKYVSCPVAVLLLVAFLRSGAIREFLDETGMTPPGALSTATNDYSCPSEYTYSAEKKMCTKGNETKNPDCADPSMMWDASVAKCITKPTTGETAGGPPGGTSPGAMAALNGKKNDTTTGSTTGSMPTTESFTPYGGKDGQEFAPL